MRINKVGIVSAIGAIFFVSVMAVGREPALSAIDRGIEKDSAQLVKEGREIFRYDTFGDEHFWGDTLRMHDAIKGEANGGVGPGVSPKTALSVGLKVDVEALPAEVQKAIKTGKADLGDPKTTLALLKLNAVVGVKGIFDKAGKMTSLGVQCAFCHSTVDNSFAPGIGHRLDGWPNRDLNVGAIVGLSPDLSAVDHLLGVPDEVTRKVLASWGAGKYDASLFLDGKAFRPDGKSAATVIPAAFGLAGVNLHTYTGWGSVPYWNSFVAVLQMHGQGTFFDSRLDDAAKFPVAARNHMGHTQASKDLVSGKLEALHYYQLSLHAPTPPKGSYDEMKAAKGKKIFEGKGKCISCHTPPLYTDPGWNMHAGSEVGIDNFQADRSPDGKYRTTPLKGLFAREKGGFYHDGRFSTYRDVVDHYDRTFKLGLTDGEKADLSEFLKSI